MKKLIFLLLLIPLTAFSADLSKEEFSTIGKRDALIAHEACLKVAYNEPKIDILKARTEAQGFVVTRTQVRVMLYTACMLKVYDADLSRMFKSLPTDGA